MGSRAVTSGGGTARRGGRPRRHERPRHGRPRRARHARGTTVARFPNDPVQTSDGLHWDILGLYGAAVNGLARGAARRARHREHRRGLVGGRLRPAAATGGCSASRSTTATSAPRAASQRCTQRMPYAELYARNGLQFLPFNTLYQFAAEPRASCLDFADTALLIPDLFGFWLTGQAARRAAPTRRRPDCSRARRRVGRRPHRRARTAARHPSPAHRTRRAARRPAARGRGVDRRRPDVGRHRGRLARHGLGRRRRADASGCRRLHLVRHVGAGRRRGRAAGAHRRGRARANFTNEGGVDGRVRLLHNIMGLWVLSEAVRTWERAGHPIDLPTLLDSADRGHRSGAGLRRRTTRASCRPATCRRASTRGAREHGVAPPRTRAEYARSIVESRSRRPSREAAHEAGRIGGVDVRDDPHRRRRIAQRAALPAHRRPRRDCPCSPAPSRRRRSATCSIQARALGAVTGSLEALRDLVARTHAPRRYEPRA